MSESENENIRIYPGQYLAYFQCKRNVIYRENYEIVNELCALILENDLNLRIAIIKNFFKKISKENLDSFLKSLKKTIKNRFGDKRKSLTEKQLQELIENLLAEIQENRQRENPFQHP